MKVLVELFDECQIENAVAGISLKPEKIIFVGFKKNMRNWKINALKRLFKEKGLKAEIECRYVSRFDFDSILGSLNEIVDSNPDCCFDITGGKEPVLVAIGIISSERKVPMVQFDIKSGDMVRVSNCESIGEELPAKTSIKECISLNGGSVIDDSELDFKWKLSEEFCSDVEKLWEISKNDSAAWNRNSIALSTMEKFGFMDDNFYVEGTLREEGNIHPDEKIMNALFEAGMIKEYVHKKGYISFTYKNEQVHKCISKAGNILELYGYILSREIMVQHPGFYTDADISIIADWDGIVDEDEIEVETRNEIDLVFMRNLIPVFVSCKNGVVQKEALYELQSVAERFGGEYAKKVLFTTYINKNADAREFILQRAADMNIQVIADVDKKSRGEIKEELLNKAR